MNRKFFVVAAVVAGTFGLVPAAFAGEGGAAGSASFTIDATSNKVTGAAVAASVGQVSASANAFNTSSGNSASAIGSASTITYTTLSAAEAGSIATGTAADTNANTNDLATGLNIDATTGVTTAQ